MHDGWQHWHPFQIQWLEAVHLSLWANWWRASGNACYWLDVKEEWKLWKDIVKRVNSNHSLGVVITCRHHIQDVTVEQWQQNLGFAPHNVILQTLARTTQLAPHVSSDFRDVLEHLTETANTAMPTKQLNAGKDLLHESWPQILLRASTKHEPNHHSHSLPQPHRSWSLSTAFISAGHALCHK